MTIRNHQSRARREQAVSERETAERRLNALRATPEVPTVFTRSEMEAHRKLDHKASLRLGGNRAPLPSVEVEEKLAKLIDLAAELADGLEDLAADEAWTDWLSAGAYHDKPKIKGPWVWYANQFQKESETIYDKLCRVADSLEFRCLRNVERLNEVS